jgi:hypothetical protein
MHQTIPLVVDGADRRRCRPPVDVCMRSRSCRPIARSCAAAPKETSAKPIGTTPRHGQRADQARSIGTPTHCGKHSDRSIGFADCTNSTEVAKHGARCGLNAYSECAMFAQSAIPAEAVVGVFPIHEMKNRAGGRLPRGQGVLKECASHQGKIGSFLSPLPHSDVGEGLG